MNWTMAGVLGRIDQKAESKKKQNTPCKMAVAAPHRHQHELEDALESTDEGAVLIYRTILRSPFETNEDTRGKELAISRLAELLAKKR